MSATFISMLIPPPPRDRREDEGPNEDFELRAVSSASLCSRFASYWAFASSIRP